MFFSFHNAAVTISKPDTYDKPKRSGHLMVFFRSFRLPALFDESSFNANIQQIPPMRGGEQTQVGRPPYSRQIDWASRYPNEVLLHGKTNRKIIAFTFDDGPDDTWTPQILTVLARFGVKATFFLIGMRVRSYPQIVQRIIRSQHVIGNHTWDHPKLTDLPADQVRKQIQQTEQEILRVAGVRPRFFRPPYGALNPTIIETAISLKNKIILWNIDSLDWSGVSTNTLVNSVLAQIKPGAIVLFHSAFGKEGLSNTVQALPRLIRALRQEGYSIQTLPKLLGISAYK